MNSPTDRFFCVCVKIKQAGLPEAKGEKERAADREKRWSSFFSIQNGNNDRCVRLADSATALNRV